MEKGTGVLVIAGACLLILFMVTVKRKMEFFLNFCLRAAMGGISIYGINLLLQTWGLSSTNRLGVCETPEPA